MKVSRVLARKLRNMIQAVIGYIELKREKDAINKLQEMSQLIDDQEVKTVDNCEDCEHKPPDGKP